MSYFSYGRNMFRTHALQFYKEELYLRKLKGKLLFVENLFSIISFWENIHMFIIVSLSYSINYNHAQCNPRGKHLWLFHEWFQCFSIEYFLMYIKESGNGLGKYHMYCSITSLLVCRILKRLSWKVYFEEKYSQQKFLTFWLQNLTFNPLYKLLSWKCKCKLKAFHGGRNQNFYVYHTMY